MCWQRPSPLRKLVCICTEMYRLCAWRSPGLRNCLYLTGRVRVIIVSISQIKKLMLYLGSEAGPASWACWHLDRVEPDLPYPRASLQGLSILPSLPSSLPLILLKISGKNTSDILV